MICTYDYNETRGIYNRNRRIVLTDATESGNHPYLYPRKIRFGGTSSSAAYVEPHLPDNYGGCAYYETDCWTDRLVSFDPSTFSGQTITGLVVDTNANGLSDFTNAPHFCVTSTDSSTTKIQGPKYSVMDSYIHRRTATSTDNGATINGFGIDQFVNMYISEVAVVACYNCTPAFFLEQAGFSASGIPTTAYYQYGVQSGDNVLNNAGRVIYAGTRTYSNRDWKIYVVASTNTIFRTHTDNNHAFVSNPCIGFNVDDFTQTLCSVHLIHVCKEFALRDIMNQG